jgi:hypothetical protein
MKQKIFQERSIQLAEYKQFYKSETDLILTTKTEASAFNNLMKDLIMRKNNYLIQQDKILEENVNLKKENELKEKEIQKLKIGITNNQMPTKLGSSTIVKRDSISVNPESDVELQKEEKIMVVKAEYDLLVHRYGIVKSTLESVLYFIVPQNLRDLVNKVMAEITEK